MKHNISNTPLLAANLKETFEEVTSRLLYSLVFDTYKLKMLLLQNQFLYKLVYFQLSAFTLRYNDIYIYSCVLLKWFAVYM